MSKTQQIQKNLEGQVLVPFEILVPSASTSGLVYKVTWTARNGWWCDCPAFVYAKWGTHPKDGCAHGKKPCKHILKAIIAKEVVQP